MRRVLNTAFVLLICYATSCLGTGWQNKQAEVYFVVDGTSSMWGSQFRKQLSLVADLVSDMDIGPGHTRVGLGVYSHEFYPIVPLNNTYDKQTLISEIRKAPHVRGNTYISLGLQGMRQEMDVSRTRANVPRIGVFFTDGKSTFSTHTYNNATRAKNSGMFVFVVGIGETVEERELKDISSDPKRYFMYRVSDFASLNTIREDLSVNMAKVNLYQNDEGTCGEKTKVDVVFVYDEFDLGSPLRASVTKFLGTIADDLRMNPGNVRVGVVSKSCPTGKDIQLGDFTTREEFKQALQQDQGKPGIDVLLRDAREKYFDTETGHRTDAKKRLVLILTNPLDEAMQVKVIEQLFRARYVNKLEVFIIRQGSNYNKGFLFLVANSPQHVLFADIETASEPFLKLFCKDI